jgi:pentatricopeptide repeat protein
MNSRLAIREKHVLNNSNIEETYIHKKFIDTELKERYIFEVDKQLEDQTQNRAIRTYTKKQILQEFPQYLRTLNDCRALIKNLGHSLKTGWRKQLFDLLNQASLETHDDPQFGESCRLKINKLILEVNKWTTLEIIAILDEIRDAYVSDKEQRDKDSKLGSNAIVLGQVLKNELDPIVPHKYSNWSADLNSFDSTKRSFNDGYSEVIVDDDGLNPLTSPNNIATNSMTLSTFDQSFDTLPTSTIKDTFNDNMLPGMIDGDGNPNNHAKTKNLAFEHMSLSQIINHMRAAAVDGNLPLCYSIFKKSFQDPIANMTEKDKEKLKIKGPGKHYPLNLDPFKLLMVAFKNGSDIQYKDAFRIIDLITSYGLKPDISIYNTMMKTCIKGSRWRRCLAFIKDMQKVFELTPNSFTFDILINSCRHSMEDPKVIFEVLRIEKYPREFCYKAALVNAGNHISQQVLRETVHDLDMMNMNDPNKLEKSMNHLTKSLDDIDIMPSTNTLSTLDMNTSKTNTSANNSLSDDQMVDNELSIDPKKWNKFRKQLLHKLPNTTPAKFVEPGTFDPALEQKLIRSFPKIGRAHV